MCEKTVVHLRFQFGRMHKTVASSPIAAVRFTFSFIILLFFMHIYHTLLRIQINWKRTKSIRTTYKHFMRIPSVSFRCFFFFFFNFFMTRHLQFCIIREVNACSMVHEMFFCPRHKRWNALVLFDVAQQQQQKTATTHMDMQVLGLAVA